MIGFVGNYYDFRERVKQKVNELKLENITREYGKKVALDNVNLSLNQGIYGLLGDNGAGKSTMMRIMVGVDRPTHGEITWNEENIYSLDGKYRGLVGYIPQEFSVYPSFTAREFLEYMGALKGLTKQELKEKIPEVLAFVNLSEVKNKKVSTFSGGMKRRIGIAQAIINDPQILIFDEPTAGLDPGERIRFSNIISDMSKDKIVLFSTHIISDIEAITTNIIILNQGEIKANTNVNQLVETMEGKVFEIYVANEEIKELKEKVHIIRMKQDGSGVYVRYTGEVQEGSKEVAPNLEDFYVFKGSEGSE